jgi:hypothetical protein
MHLLYSSLPLQHERDLAIYAIADNLIAVYFSLHIFDTT